MRFEVLGPIGATDPDGGRVPLGGPRHREVLALLLTARGRVVPLSSLVDDLWEDEPPRRAVGSVRTFVSDLRRTLEPGTLVTEGAGYALLTEDVDAVRAERALLSADTLDPADAEPLLAGALAEWKGEPYAEFAERAWARPERARLAELQAQTVERLAAARLALGRTDAVVLALDAHVAAHPWREEGWRLLAEALYRGGRRADALAVLRRARERLADALGLDPGRRLAELETRILRDDVAPATSVLLGAADAHRRTSVRIQLTSSVPLIASLAVSGDLAAAQRQRLAAIRAAEPFDDPELTARVIGGYDVPAIWTRSDDEAAAAAVVAAAERALAGGAPTPLPPRLRARLLATIATEDRGTAAREAEAREAERLARDLGDPALLAFALGGRWMQEFGTCGRAARRDAIGVEMVDLALTHDLPNAEIQGRLIRMQALAALGSSEAATAEADAVDALAHTHERPLASVFTGLFRAMTADAGYEAAVAAVAGSGMEGLAPGLLSLIRAVRATQGDGSLPEPGDDGPYRPWLDALRGSRAPASVPDPPQDLLQEVLWVLLGRAATGADDIVTADRVRTALSPAAVEIAAGSGVVSAGPVRALLDALPQRASVK